MTHLFVTDEILSADAGSALLGIGQINKQIGGGADEKVEKAGRRGVNKRSECRCVEMLEALIGPLPFSLSPHGRAPQPLRGSEPQSDQSRHCFLMPSQGAFTVPFAFSLFYVLP